MDCAHDAHSDVVETMTMNLVVVAVLLVLHCDQHCCWARRQGFVNQMTVARQLGYYPHVNHIRLALPSRDDDVVERKME